MLAGQCSEIHHHALRRELAVCVEAIEGDERQLDIAAGGREALKLADVLAGQPTLDDDLIVGQVLVVAVVRNPANAPCAENPM